MLRDSVTAVVVVVRTRPRAVPLAMITLRKSTHGFLFLSYMSMGLRLAVPRAARAPLKIFHFKSLLTHKRVRLPHFLLRFLMFISYHAKFQKFLIVEQFQLP